MWPQSVLGWWCFAPTLGESLYSFHPSWACNASGEQQWVKRLPSCQSQAGEEPGDLQPVRGGPWDPPLIHKTCHAKSFHAPASARWSRKVHLFISQKMFMERNYQQEKTNSLVRYCPLCNIYFCGSVDNGDGVRLEFGVPERTGRKPDFTKTPEQGDSATWVPAYRLGWKKDLQWRFWD